MTQPTAPTAGTTGPPPLYRDPSEGILAGVCAAVGRYTGTDPVIWRIVTVVLAVFGGAGLVLYVLAWLLIPKVGEERSIVESWLRRDHNLSGKALVAIGIVALVLVSGFGDGRGAAAIAVLAVVGYLVYRDRQGRALLAATGAAAAPPAAPASSPEASPPGQTVAAPWAAPAPPAPRVRSRLGGLTLSTAALVTGGLIWARLAGADGLTAPRIVATALLIVGAGLVVGTWYGRARWLAPIGLVLCVVLAGTAAASASDVSLRGGFGQRSWAATATQPHQDFRLGVGEATLDLTRLPANGPHQAVTAHVGLGHLIVLVPADVPIALHAKVRAGDISEDGRSLVNGADHVERVLHYGPPGDPQVEVEATVGAGQVEVRRG